MATFSCHDIRLGRVYFGRKVVGIGACAHPDGRFPTERDRPERAAQVEIRFTTKGPFTTSWPSAQSATDKTMYCCKAKSFAAWVRKQQQQRAQRAIDAWTRRKGQP